jgi:hypothetical protein
MQANKRVQMELHLDPVTTKLTRKLQAKGSSKLGPTCTSTLKNRNTLLYYF